MSNPHLSDGRGPLLVSMSVNELRRAARGEDDQLTAFASVVADCADGIELFVESSKSFMSLTRGVPNYAESLDLSIHTIHAPPLGVFEDGIDARWDVELNTHLKEILLRYDTPAEGPRDDRDNADEIDVRRVPKLEPVIATTHPPRFPEKTEASLSAARRRLVEAVRQTTDYIAGERFLDFPWDPPMISVENVCPRPGFDYLLTEPEDVYDLRSIAAEMDERDTLQFTCDIGHTDVPTDMLNAMESPSCVHLHGVSSAPPSRVASDLPGDIDTSLLQPEPADGTIQHLPPQRFPDRSLAALEWLEEANVRCPLVVKLQSACKTAEIAEELFEWFEANR